MIARLPACLLLTACLLLSASPGANCQAPDHSLLAQVLSRHVRDGQVDYAALKADRAPLDTYLKQLAALDIDALPAQEAFAAYVNLYNAATLALVLDHYPVASIRDIGGLFSSPWKLPVVKTLKGTITLDHLEHGILRKRFADPRLHAAINCASRGCPPLAAVPYTGARLEEQLDHASRAMLAEPDRARLEGSTLFVSAIFDWFGEDFGGRKGVLAFAARHAPEPLAQRIRAAGEGLGLKYLPYDWSLNGR